MKKTIQKEQLMRLTIGYVNNPNNSRQCTWGEFISTICDVKLLEACNKLAAIPYDAEHREERQALFLTGLIRKRAIIVF